MVPFSSTISSTLLESDISLGTQQQGGRERDINNKHNLYIIADLLIGATVLHTDDWYAEILIKALRSGAHAHWCGIVGPGG